MVEPETNPVVLYDGVCGLCNRTVQFILKRDHRDVFQFAPLQSGFAEELLQRHGINVEALDTVYVVVDHKTANERLLSRSDAVLFLLSRLGWKWKWTSLGRILPRALRDALYGLVARNRYQVFGKFESCLLPDPKVRHKFLDV